MAASAVQYQQKPEKKPENRPRKAATPEQKGAGKLQRLPRAAGVALMVLLLVLSLFVGNFRALQNATPKAFIRQGDVKSIVEDRVAQAGNIAAVAERANLNTAYISELRAASEELAAAKTAREISRADQRLSAAAAELTTAAGLGEEEAKNMTRAADNFAEQGSFLRQEARTFNKQAEKAEALYEMLPTKFLLSAPDVYEGV